MISTYQRLKRRRDVGEINGFTLIELLIVIVVLGILAAVVIFALGGVTGKSQIAACQADGATVSTGISALKAQDPNSSITTANLLGGGAGGPYIQSWPSATLSTNGYAYSLGTGGVLQLVTENGGAVTANGSTVTFSSTTPENYTTPADCGGA